MGAIKLYTLFSPSHKKFFDKYLKPSLAEVGMQVVKKEIPQDCKTARFEEDGWNISMKRNIEYIIEAIRESKDEYLIYSDADIYFFSSPEEELLKTINGYDIVFQDNKDKGQRLCAGFFLCRTTEKVLNFFELLKRGLFHFDNDQHAINELKHNLKYGILSERFFCLGKIWNGKDIELPKNCVMFHANWAVGVAEKLRLMEKAVNNGVGLDK